VESHSAEWQVSPRPLAAGATSFEICNVNFKSPMHRRPRPCIVLCGGNTMEKLAIWAYLEAKPGKEKEIEEFLKSAQPLAEKESGTVAWYAVKIDGTHYGIFDTFADE